MFILSIPPYFFGSHVSNGFLHDYIVKQNTFTENIAREQEMEERKDERKNDGYKHNKKLSSKDPCKRFKSV